MKKQIKRYPFNMHKHQHDILFRYNRAKNTENWELATQLANLLNYGVGIVYLTGKEYGLAQESIAWANEMR